MGGIVRWRALARIAVVLGIAGLGAVPAARAEDNGVGARPAMGWSSWSFLRHSPTEASVEAQANAMVSSGLRSVGYRYVNLDDFWYQCPGSQGPNVDRYGRWVIDASKFPSQGSVNGIEATANYVHSLGLKFGIYVTPGISSQAVAQNTQIKGTPYTADQIATTASENNYNCGGMVGIDYSKPGAQAFINSWADQFARWHVDYVKLDGVGSFDIPDVEAWSGALRQTGRKIHLELSNSLNINDASTWAKYSNGWRTTGDIECYCSSSSYPLTDWSNVESRFDSVAAWAPYGGPGGFNDYDSIEVGNGDNDGLTPDERQTQMSLWALGASPFILGTDLTNLDPLDLSYLKNRAVISVDQDAIDAHRIVNTATTQVFTKQEQSGDAVVGLFNTGSGSQVISTNASKLGLSGGQEYAVHDLWNRTVRETAGRISEEVPAHGVALLRVAPPAKRPIPPLTSLQISGRSQEPGDDTFTEKVAFTDDGVQAVHRLSLSLNVPSGWTETAKTATTAVTVASGETVTAAFRVSAPAASQPFQTGTLTASAADDWAGRAQSSTTDSTVTLTGGPVQSPYLTYSSATDAPATFSQVGDQFGIEGAGADVYTGADDYSAIYQSGVVGTSATITTELTGEQNLAGYAKAGIMVRNDIAGAGTAPEGVILFDSPSGGIQLEYDDNGGQYIDNVTPPNGTIPSTVPVYLKLVRSGDTYTGSYSTDGTTWEPVGSATVPDQASTQDAGMFEVSHDPGVTGIATFDRFTIS
ncbi:MAG TPA: NEW3 domain-containing protein [Solirubrobacteraceae bacterium]|nr:NEW3 domain-containing protein [Solirubrobacteraceae bacterium]